MAVANRTIAFPVRAPAVSRPGAAQQIMLSAFFTWLQNNDPDPVSLRAWRRAIELSAGSL